MKATEIIYNASKSPKVLNLEEIDSQCLVCGKHIKLGVPVKKIISGSFTNWSNCTNRKGKYVCKECAYCIKEPSLRKNNIISDSSNLYLLKKNDLENFLFDIQNYIKGEFIIGITQSFKKHNSFRCKVNNDYKCFYIREEDKEYLFDTTKLKNVYKLLNYAYLQFSKDELKTGNYRMIGIQQFGIEKFQKYESVFKEYRGTAQFNLMIYMLNSERRNEYIKNRGKSNV